MRILLWLKLRDAHRRGERGGWDWMERAQMPREGRWADRHRVVGTGVWIRITGRRAHRGRNTGVQDTPAERSTEGSPQMGKGLGREIWGLRNGQNL